MLGTSTSNNWLLPVDKPRPKGLARKPRCSIAACTRARAAPATGLLPRQRCAPSIWWWCSPRATRAGAACSVLPASCTFNPFFRRVQIRLGAASGSILLMMCVAIAVPYILGELRKQRHD